LRSTPILELKHIAFVLFLFFISNGIYSDNVLAEKNSDLKRVNLLVSDLEQSLTIYKDTLGMEVFEITKSSLDSYSYPVFNLPKKAEIRFATLNIGEDKRAFALTEVKNVTLPSNEGIRMSTVVIAVSGLNNKYKKIGSMGLSRTEIDMDITPEGKSFSEFSFLDFDGHLIVLYEIKD
jgi:catechol 2,3-dioxygenase-like lactoylglutathione lyase family enzyme